MIDNDCMLNCIQYFLEQVNAPTSDNTHITDENTVREGESGDYEAEEVCMDEIDIEIRELMGSLEELSREELHGNKDFDPVADIMDYCNSKYKKFFHLTKRVIDHLESKSKYQ